MFQVIKFQVQSNKLLWSKLNVIKIFAVYRYSADITQKPQILISHYRLMNNSRKMLKRRCARK